MNGAPGCENSFQLLLCMPSVDRLLWHSTSKVRGFTRSLGWLPALYLQKSELEPSASRDAMRQAALDLARLQRSRGLEQRILCGEPAKSN